MYVTLKKTVWGGTFPFFYFEQYLVIIEVIPSSTLLKLLLEVLEELYGMLRISHHLAAFKALALPHIYICKKDSMYMYLLDVLEYQINELMTIGH